MKVAIWVEQGVTQLVLTPENEWEKSVTRAVSDGDQPAKIMRGTFYDCNGGWTRQTPGEESLILRVDCRENDDHGLETVPRVVEQ